MARLRKVYCHQTADLYKQMESRAKPPQLPQLLNARTKIWETVPEHEYVDALLSGDYFPPGKGIYMISRRKDGKPFVVEGERLLALVRGGHNSEYELEWGVGRYERLYSGDDRTSGLMADVKTLNECRAAAEGAEEDVKKPAAEARKSAERALAGIQHWRPGEMKLAELLAAKAASEAAYEACAPVGP